MAGDVAVPQVHGVLIGYIRQQIERSGGELAAKFAALSDAALVRMMFSNYRGRETVRGLRLTQFGLSLMERYFVGCEVAVPANQKWCSADLLYLDSRAAMPYYCSSGRLILYDHLLGIKLKLAGGKTSILIEIEGGH